VGTIPELLATDHPWIKSYFNGPRGRAALASSQRREDTAAMADANAGPGALGTAAEGA
jgi:phospholipid/cholesterol/gamma-HCH transport system ATP-binding protein